MKASDLLVMALENEGVERIYAVPGEENVHVLESIRTSGITLTINRHEQGAGFMAATEGRLTGHPGVCLGTLGPGATNLITPAAFAQLGAMPLVIITGQKPIHSGKQGQFQILNVLDLMQPVTKFTRQISHGESIPALVREAFRVAAEERPGTVHLELPEDVAAEQCDASVFPVVGHLRPQAPAAAIDQAARMIEAARHPLLLVGAGANRKRVSTALTAFVDTTGIPFFTTQMGKGVVDERHPLYLGTAALSESDFLHCAIQHADLIINVGHDVVEKPPFLMHHDAQQVIHVNFSAAEVAAVYFPQLNVVGDIADSVARIGHEINAATQWDLSYFKRVKAEIDTRLATYFLDTRFPMLPQRLVNLLRNRLPESAIIGLDNGIYKLWFARNYSCYQANTLLLDNALATMGAGLSVAMAASLHYPDTAVVAVCGDGGFMMNAQELETAVRLKLNLVVIVLNDNAFGMIKWKQKAMGFADFGLDYQNPNFVTYAESYGAQGHLIESDEHFQATLNLCLSTGGVQVIELPVDYSLNHDILNVLLDEKNCSFDAADGREN